MLNCLSPGLDRAIHTAPSPIDSSPGSLTTVRLSFEFREGLDRPREPFLPRNIKFNQLHTQFRNKWTYKVERRFVWKGQIEVLDMGTGCGNASQDVNAIISWLRDKRGLQGPYHGAACKVWVVVKGVASLEIGGLGISIDNKLLALGSEVKWSMLPPKDRRSCNGSHGRRAKWVEDKAKSPEKRKCLEVITMERKDERHCRHQRRIQLWRCLAPKIAVEANGLQKTGIEH